MSLNTFPEYKKGNGIIDKGKAFYVNKIGFQKVYGLLKQFMIMNWLL